MCLGSREDFSGGYDYFKQAGLVQVANHHIAPGKKQWTWGNHEFGYAWDRNLTDRDGPYVELMIGVYTDNQPDFSFLQPGETKTWSVYWYPIQKIGPAQAANTDAALSFERHGQRARIGVAVTRDRKVRIELWRGAARLHAWTRSLAPDRPFLHDAKLPKAARDTEIQVLVRDERGGELLRYAPRKKAPGGMPPPATEPPLPSKVAGNDELYLTGLHLAQYRHATRSPVAYWEEALRRDPGDARCNNAMGVWHLRRGEFGQAETYLRAAIARLTARNANPADGEAYYHLGLVRRFLERDDEAYDAFYKATWNQAWQAAGYHALAEIDATRRNWSAALDHLDRALRLNADNLRARNLRARILRERGEGVAADAVLAETLKLDPLDAWARWLARRHLKADTQTRIDVALDCARAGFYADAVALLEEATPEPLSGTAPLVQYHLACFHDKLGQRAKAAAAARHAAAATPDYCFPARVEEIAVLRRALARDPRDARAAYYLGNLCYDRRRHREAIAFWERSVRHEPNFSVAWRNLGIAYFNIERSGARAQRAYERALRADPGDPRLVYERDQLWKRMGAPVTKRLRELEKRRALVEQRDASVIELCALYNQTGRPERALEILQRRKFQPWEGGEGQALGQHVRTHLALGQAALKAGRAPEAVRWFEGALQAPGNLGEARHVLANASDIYFWLGEAQAAAGDRARAREWWRRASESRGDFQEMSVRSYSEMTYYSALSLERLGRAAAARKLLRELGAHARRLARTPAKIDYFATSLPTMLLFDDDLDHRQQTTALFLQAQCAAGLRQWPKARRFLSAILARDPSHAAAADLRRQLAGGAAGV
jgi:tetratricopeptide (TPR) repeat protein